MKRMYLHSDAPGNWFENRNLSSEKAHWPAIAVDSNDAVHIAYHIGANKHLKYLTNASGSWIAPVLLDGYGGWGSVMEIDANDDIFIAHSAPANNAIHLTTVKGSGQGLTAMPVFDITPPLPDGLTMNWRTGTYFPGTPTEVKMSIPLHCYSYCAWIYYHCHLHTLHHRCTRKHCLCRYYRHSPNCYSSPISATHSPTTQPVTLPHGRLIQCYQPV